MAGSAVLAAGALVACGRNALSSAEVGIAPGIQLGLPFPFQPTTLADEGVGYCFGAGQVVAGVQVCHTVGAYRDDFNAAVAPQPVHDLAWWKQHHPDWLVYKADRTTPAGVGDAEADGRVVLDISNPAVQQYQFDYFLKPYINMGWTRVGFDNVGIGNPHNFWSGVYRNGQWVQLYSGHEYDSAIMHTWTDWAKAMHDKVKAFRASAQLDANYSVPLNNQQNFPILLPYFDGYFNEQGFTGAGGGFVSDGNWQGVFKAQQLYRRLGKLVFVNGLVPITVSRSAAGDVPTSTLARQSETNITQAQALWVVANYLLVKGRDYFSCLSGLFKDGGFSQQNYNIFYYFPENYLPIGHPVAEAEQWHGVYRRDYSGGIVLVNPSSSDRATLHVGNPLRPLHNADGQRVAALTMAPVSGMVLTHSVPTAPRSGAGGTVLPPQLRGPYIRS